MTSTFNIKVEGLDELMASFQKASSQATNLIGDAMYKSVNLIHNDARRPGVGRFQNQTGNLRNSGIQKRVVSPMRGEIFVTEKYGLYVEMGTGPHVILPRKGKMLMFRVGGQPVFARRVNHPGSKPYPYMQPAFENNQEQVLDYFAQARDQLTKTMAGK